MAFLKIGLIFHFALISQSKISLFCVALKFHIMRSIVLAYILQFSQAFAANNLSAMGMNWMHSVTPMETEVYQGTMSKVKSNDESIGVVHKLGSMDEFYNASILDLLQDTTNSFIFEKSRDAVYYDRRMRKWYLQTFSSKKPPVKDILVPITWCYDMTAGKGGSIKQSFLDNRWA